MNCKSLSILIACPFLLTCAPTFAGNGPFNVLVFSKTSGFRHSSISDGITLIQSLGAANNFSVVTTEDANDFTLANLSQYAVVVWLSTTGDVLNDTQQAAFEAYIQQGGGWVGIHAATDCEYDWPWYGQLIGNDAWFQSHPSIQNATLIVDDATHISTTGLPASFTFNDEWYNFRANPRPVVNVLLTIDESSYNPGANAMGADHPMSWYHEFDGGRAWYTALGHRSETFADARFQSHVLGGILWAANAVCECPADMNGDSNRNALDIGAFVSCLLDVGPDCDCADADSNGSVDLTDVTAFVGVLLEPTGAACPT